MKIASLWWLLPLLRLLLVMTVSTDDGSNNNRKLNSFAIEVDGGLQSAQAVAKELGFLVDRELPNIGVFVLTHKEVEHRSKRNADYHVSRLIAHPKVRSAQQEVEVKRVKRSIVHDKQLEMPIREIKDNSIYHRVRKPIVTSRDYENVIVFNDPNFEDMWYLKNRGQSGGEKYLDLNVEVSWQSGFNGEGVVLCILDDGVDHTHPDLAANYDPRASTDLNDKNDHTKDPMPNMTNPDNKHGTRCAGEIAAVADNNVCGVGVAYKSRIGGVRILDGIVTDSLEGEALSFNRDYIHIYSASWGPFDDGKTMEGPGKFATRAFIDGVHKGRNGLGSIFVWATGNGGMFGDNCNADGFTSRIETLSVGSISDRGRQPYYMENCTSTLAVVPTGGQEYEGQELEEGSTKLKVITTDVEGGCIENFQGTSSAAPLAAGCIANVLQANPNLTWRDVQHIVVNATRIPSADASWTINGAGYHVSNKFGFGLMDCGKMVQLAQDWNNVPEQHVCRFLRKSPAIIELRGERHDFVYVNGCKDDQARWIQRLEHVQVRIRLKTQRRGDTEIILVSPVGTRSVLLSPRRRDSFSGQWEFTFMSVHHWGEYPTGTWKLEVYDRTGDDHGAAKINNKEDVIEEWELIMYGTAGERFGRAFSKKKITSGRHVPKAFVPSVDMVNRIKRDETLEALQIRVKPARTQKTKIDKNYSNKDRFSEDNIKMLAARLSNIISEDKEEQDLTQVITEQRSLHDENEDVNARHGLNTKSASRYENSPNVSNRNNYYRFDDEDQRLLVEVLQGLEAVLNNRNN